MTFLTLGQSDPPSPSLAFAGDLAHFGLWSKALPKKDLEQIAKCSGPVAESEQTFSWEEGVWESVIADSEAEPIPILLERREVRFWLKNVLFIVSRILSLLFTGLLHHGAQRKNQEPVPLATLQKERQELP